MDVREVLRTTLGWDFSFASSDPSVVRSLVVHPEDASRLAEWLVRELPPLSSTASTQNTIGRSPKQDKRSRPRQLEMRLAEALSFKGSVRSLLSSVRTNQEDCEYDQEVGTLQQQVRRRLN